MQGCQLLNCPECLSGVMIMTSKPYNSPQPLLVDTSHERDLRILFLDVILVDAYRVDP
jgi:hypothetical protein